MLPNWLYGKSKSKLATILGGGGGAPADYNQVKAQVEQNTNDIVQLTQDVDTNANNINSVKSGVLKLKSYNNEQQLTPNTSYTIPNMNGIYLVFLTRSGIQNNCGVYLTQCHTNESNVVLPLAEVTATGFSMSFSGTSLVIATGNTEPRVRFMQLTSANY